MKKVKKRKDGTMEVIDDYITVSVRNVSRKDWQTIVEFAESVNIPMSTLVSVFAEQIHSRPFLRNMVGSFIANQYQERRTIAQRVLFDYVDVCPKCENTILLSNFDEDTRCPECNYLVRKATGKKP